MWKLYGRGSVGSQALTGIPALQRIRRRTGSQIWPFETLGDGRSHVLAEIYPSLIEDCPNAYEHRVKDARQVSDVAAAFQELDRTGELAQHLRVPRNMPDRVCREEGAILRMQDPEGFQAAARRVVPCC